MKLLSLIICLGDSMIWCVVVSLAIHCYIWFVLLDMLLIAHFIMNFT